MLYDVHNVSDLIGHPRTIAVRHIQIPPGSSIVLPAPMPRELQKAPRLCGLLAVPAGDELPSWVVEGRRPKAAPVKAVAVVEEVRVDYSELKVAEMALIYKEVVGTPYTGRRRRVDVTAALEQLDQAAVVEAIG